MCGLFPGTRQSNARPILESRCQISRTTSAASSFKGIVIEIGIALFLRPLNSINKPLFYDRQFSSWNCEHVHSRSQHESVLQGERQQHQRRSQPMTMRTNQIPIVFAPPSKIKKSIIASLQEPKGFE